MNGSDERSTRHRGAAAAGLFKALTAVVLAACLAGCGGESKGPKLVDVSGRVLLDGQPLPKGVIVFDPADGAGGSSAGDVRDGAFRLACAPGRKKVAVTAFRETDRRDEYGGPVLEPTIPARYNTQTTLTADVPTAGTNELAFPLTSNR